MRKVSKACTFLSLLGLLSACKLPDACNGGENMGDPRIADGFDARADAPELHLLWDQGTGAGALLPASYFDQVHTDHLGKHQELVASAEHIAPREIVIRLQPSQLADQLAGDSELSFTLEFPDRRYAIDCVHPASDDTYLVHIALQLQDGALVSWSVTQEVWLGPF